ncbi:hypothetical protein GCM10010136_13620 [Limoniibacter endophyticus]|uniref:Uncharacterized protein n=2 Tax=Limoniibacter endophyticus TaxID=1565040 RepID=A0A8J3GGG5_9HYPH|nr:hypothetical protein GCM10010136_13620 [Limoniibacter endophyticus]
MDGRKLCESFLSVGSNANETYDIFRCHIPTVALGAAETAKLMWSGVKQRLVSFHGMKIAYSGSGKKGALRSIAAKEKYKGDKTETVFDRLLSTQSSAFFCSDHVVTCYQIAIEQVAAQGDFRTTEIEKIFKLESHCYQPAYLWRTLKKSSFFTFVGSARAGNQVWSKSYLK